jgi:hypothetical protein
MTVASYSFSAYTYKMNVIHVVLVQSNGIRQSLQKWGWDGVGGVITTHYMYFRNFK